MIDDDDIEVDILEVVDTLLLIVASLCLEGPGDLDLLDDDC